MNHALIHEGKVVAVIAWDGEQHYTPIHILEDGSRVQVECIPVDKLVAADRDGKRRVREWQSVTARQVADHSINARACCLPTRHEHVHLEIEETVQEHALAKLENREPDPERIRAAVARHRESIIAERTAAMVAAGKPVTPGDARVQEARVKACVPEELCAARALARAEGADEIEAERAIQRAKREGKDLGEEVRSAIGRTKKR